MPSIGNRRSFVKAAAGIAAGLGMANQGMSLTPIPEAQNRSEQPPDHRLPDNDLVLFDNFHVGNRRSYSWRAKFAAAQHAGFDGFEFAGTDPKSDSWKEAMELTSSTHFKTWGFHWTTNAVIDKNADKINSEIEKIIENVEICSKSGLDPYFTLSLSGTDELSGPTVHERGSAKAMDRHWERAYKIISAFDNVCAKSNANGSLYPHINWICDMPQSMVKILNGADARHIGPAFCSHHWYGNKASDELDDVLNYPIMKKLNYVVLTNGLFRDTGFNAVRFDEGQIDMAWVLAKIYDFGYEGPISSQGWAIGGDPYIASKRFVDTIQSLRKRFVEQPELSPLV